MTDYHKMTKTQLVKKYKDTAQECARLSQEMGDYRDLINDLNNHIKNQQNEIDALRRYREYLLETLMQALVNQRKG